MSLSGSGFLLDTQLWHRRHVLREMRDRSGGPSLPVRALALLLAALLASPLVVLVLRSAVQVLDRAL